MGYVNYARVFAISLRLCVRRGIIAAIAVAVMAAALAGCSSTSGSGGDGRLKVATATNVITDLARTFGGDRVDVTGLADCLHLLTDRLWVMVALSVLIGRISAAGGYWGAIQLDASIAGTMGVAATVVFALTLLASPRYGLIVRRLQRETVPAPLA
ncbi:MAG: hypothetical protein OEM67_05850 [Thermoleophilia bacterium]|nr:hypothetical protein [Thermoleophilia bacterium]MDH3725489.1 hypothetical protein [Thermoleophilia bacterium]